MPRRFISRYELDLKLVAKQTGSQEERMENEERRKSEITHITESCAEYFERLALSVPNIKY